MSELVIDPELQALIPPLSKEEYATLEQNIIRDGCRDPLVTWLGTIVDGHNRHRICTEHGLPYSTKPMDFADKAAARIWMRSNQMGRRNLTPAWRIELELGNKEDLRLLGRANMQAGGRVSAAEKEGLSPNDKPLQQHNTRKTIAQASGVSTGQVGMAEQVRKKSPALWEKAKQGEVSVSAAYKTVKKKERREEIIKDREARHVAAKQTNVRCNITHASLVSLLDGPPGFADWVVTDPPYPKQYLGLYDDLARVSAYVLKDGGSLLCMTGQTYLPQVMQSLCAELNYHWMIAYLTPGGQAVQQFPRKVNAFWKPVIWMTKGEYSGGWVGDATKSSENDKDHHHWGQSESGMLDLMRRFVLPGHEVVDPFLGAGTTGIVCADLGAHFTGCDIDKTSFETASRRLHVAAI